MIKKPRVGDKIKGWVIGRIHDWPKYWDLDMFKEGETMGALRIMKESKFDRMAQQQIKHMKKIRFLEKIGLRKKDKVIEIINALNKKYSKGEQHMSKKVKNWERNLGCLMIILFMIFCLYFFGFIIKCLYFIFKAGWNLL